jgi:3-oxoacyl-(acyl-carrier-protein) synthase
MTFEILDIGVTSPAGNSLEAVLSSMAKPPRPEPLEFANRQPLDDTAGLCCDLSQTREFLDPMKIRRWGRLQTMSLLAAKKLQLSKILNGAEARTGVYVGSGMGSLGETSIFLENMVRQNENFPKPANFVNSVHNAVASTLGLEFGLKGENITVTHREVSFDAALGHALSALRQDRIQYAVVCGVDEMNYFYALAGKEKGLWKHPQESFEPLASGNSKGTFPGEGATVCVLSTTRPTEGSLGRVLGVKHGRYKRSARTYVDLSHVGDFLERLVSSAGFRLSDVDLILSGANGDGRLDAVYREIGNELGCRSDRKIPHATFKQLCGDYRAASGFGFAVAALCLRSGMAPPALFADRANLPQSSIKMVLLYHLSRSGVHSACLLGSS